MKFYRFEQIITERLQAIVADDDVSIFQRIDENGVVINPKQCGLLVKFVIDRTVGKADDQDEFVQYLMRNNLSIDVFDADSLMHLGKVSIALRARPQQDCWNVISCIQVVLRQTQEAVHSYLQIPIACSSMPQKGYTFNGALLLHVGNIGHGSARSLAHEKRPNPLIIRKSLRTVYNPHVAPSTRIRAKSMGIINDSALQKFLSAQKVETSTNDDNISAMERIEQWNKLREINHPSFTKKTLKRFIFQEELEAYKQLRNENKASRLLKVVFQGITTEHAIYPSLGQMEFFEFQLQNTNSIAVKCRPVVTDNRLRLVTDQEEWLYLRKINNISTTIDRDIFDNSRTHILLKPLETVYINNISTTIDRDIFDNSRTHILLKPLETVYVPFKYEHTYNTLEDDIDLTPFSVKAVFQRSSGEPVSILDLNVNPRGYVVNQSYRFFHDSEVKFQKVMRITNIPNNRHILKIRSSDPTVLCKLRNGNDGSQHIVLNTHSGATPGVKTFLVLFYGDQFYFRLLSTWQISVHSCNRVSVQTIQGQATKIPLPLKLESVPDPFVQIFGSHSTLRIDPPNAVLGSSFREGDPPVAIFTPDKRIDQVLMVTAVDQSLRQLLSAWLIYTSVKQPNITKSYNVTLSVGGNKVITKKIALENQYNIQQRFRVHSSDENLVILSQEYYDVGANQATSVVLCFQPVVENPTKKEVSL
uniref:Calponin-homology (CH) domain-containing protein n=1 Tax=Steinernema glaseri TaxID=37863 RepID=A0A1I7ZCV5_9BILA